MVQTKHGHSPAARHFCACGHYRWLVAAACLWLCAAVVLAAEPLQIGRLPTSAYSDVAERVIGEAGRRAGVAMQFQKIPLQRSLPMANDGELDGELMRTRFIDVAFPNLIRLPTPVVLVDYALYGKTPDIRSKTREQLRQLSFGIPRGMINVQKSVEGLQVSEGASFAAVLDMLESTRFDVAIIPYVEAEIEIRQRKLNGIYGWEHFWLSEPTYFALHRKHQALIPVLERALVQMEKEGLIRKYYLQMLEARGIPPSPN